MTGGAIQLANLPGSVTRPISEATNSRSSGVGSHWWRCACHCASDRISPSGDMRMPASVPIWRLKALCGTCRRKAMPLFSMTLFQRPMPATESRMKSSRSTSFNAFSIGTSTSRSLPLSTDSTR
ncbi:Uncharacterised protein [Achromobacter xylosoxidans]|nr:Uncharacterised protein [Achromobacter xylosoxidans]